MGNVKVTEKPQLSVGIEFMLMGAMLNASYQKTDNGYRIFVAPTKVDSNVGITIKEMVEQFNSMSGAGLTDTEVKDKIKTQSGDLPADFDFGSVRFILKMLFLDIEVKTGDTESKSAEYAFSLKVDASSLIPPQITIINIDSLSFNIWNTQRENVLDRMSLVSPEDF